MLAYYPPAPPTRHRVYTILRTLDKEGIPTRAKIFDESQEELLQRILGFLMKYNISHELEVYDPSETL